MKTLSKVLVVDDVAANRRIIEFIIDELDIELFFAASGNEAIRLVKEHQFSVVLMDVHMPGMTGIEATRLIHQQKATRDTAVIMVTGLDQEGDLLMEAYEAGAVDYIVKPIEPAVILSKVAQFVDLDRQYKLLELARFKQVETSSQLKTFLNSAGEGIIGIDTNGVITFANPKASAILHFDQALLKGTHLRELFDTSTSEQLNWSSCQLSTFIGESISGRCDNEMWHRHDGEPFFIEYTHEPILDDSDTASGSVMMFQDISKRKAVEEELKYLASYDPMTKLMNRGYFYDHLQRAIARAKRSVISLCIVVLDLDHFKYINDTYGHDCGDLLLKVVSQRLLKSVRGSDLVARLGGDEFGVVLFDMNSIACIGPIVQKILESVIQDIDLKVAKVNVSCSIGVFQYDDFDLDMDQVLKNADIALYEAKQLGRNNYQLFIPNMHNEIIEKKHIQMMLQRAVANNEFSLAYQPKTSLTRKKVMGCEALLRWTPEKGESISPAKFIPIAEESGQIIEIGEWVIDQACRQACTWHKQGIRDFTVAINVSTRQLKTEKFYVNFIKVLNHYAIPPGLIELEITETGTLDNQSWVVDEIEKLYKLGVRIAIDDFGTGNASFDYLRKFPLNTVKIDRSFIIQIGQNSKDEEIIRVILAVAHAMNLEVVAEGAETLDQIEFLTENKCEIIQGYYFSKPIPSSEMTSILQHASSCFKKQFNDIHFHNLKDTSLTRQENNGAA